MSDTTAATATGREGSAPPVVMRDRVRLWLAVAITVAISLPFGRRAVAVSPIIHVDKDASETEMESKRQELTAALNLATDRAYALVDGVR